MMENTPNQVKHENKITMNTSTFFGISGLAVVLIFALIAGLGYAVVQWKLFEGKSQGYENVLFKEDMQRENVDGADDAEIIDKGLQPTFASNAEKKKVWTKGIKDEIAKPYISRFLTTAQTEQQKYGIPTSITLAQGILESSCGQSRLATRNYNHFGIKCFRKDCPKGHCSNHSDDHHKDFFRIYKSAWQSYRDHSIFLNGKRYKHLQNYGTDYKAWANGLKKAGYATDKNYAKKLIEIIERFELYKYDI